MIPDNRRIRIKPDVLMQTVGDEAVLLNLATEQYIGLNPVAAKMWSALSCTGNLDSACMTLRQEYEVSEAALRRDLHHFVGELLEQQLIDVT